MSIAIKNGLFKLNITDHHAVLGISLDAEPKQIRLRYLKIAQKLHPDKCRNDQEKKKVAGQILSKLVNPAYEQLSRKSTFAEHQLVLTQIGKRLVENKTKINVKTSVAQELLATKGSIELTYPKLLKKLTKEQYSSLGQSKEEIEAISELNMVYLMLKSEQGINRSSNQPTTTNSSKATISQSKSTQSQASSTAEKPLSEEEPNTESRISAFVNRAQQYISKGEFDRGIKELKDALRIDPNHGITHAVMGKAYLHKKQLTMAKIHIEKAYAANPHHQIVMDSKKALDKMTRISQKSKSSHPKATDKSSNKNSKPGASGFFSGIFGSKKK